MKKILSFIVFVICCSTAIGSTGTLTESEIKSNFTSSAHNYGGGDATFVDGDVTWYLSDYNTTANSKWFQVKKDAGVYLRITTPENTKITQIVLTITSANNSKNGAQDISKHTAYSGRIALLTADAAGSSSMEGVGYTETITNNTATITTTGSNRILYLKTQNSARIWGATVTYESNVPSCTSSIIITKSAPSNGSFNVYQGSVGNNNLIDFTSNEASLDNCGTGKTTLVIVPQASTHYHLDAVTVDGNTISGSNNQYSVEYDKGSDVETEIAVTFAADPTALYIGDGSGDKTKLGDYSYPAAIPEELAKQYDINGWEFTGCWSKNEFVSADGTTAFAKGSYFVNGKDYGASANLYAIYQQGTVFSTKPVACVDISKATITINDINPTFNTSSKKWETTISWSEVNGADEYAYEVRNTTDNSEVTSGSTSSNSLSITTLANENKAYKVTIIASNSCPSDNMTEDFEKIFSITKKYTLSYNTDGGSTAPATSYEFAEATITAASAPTKTGYTFTGWKLGSTETIKQAGETFSMPSSDLELIAQWQIKSFTVTFNKNANDAEGTMSNQVQDYSTTPVALTANAFTREGYQFMGWATTSDGAVVYTNGANYTFTANADLYAVWAELHTVTYTAATGTAPAEVEVAEGTQTTLPNALTGMPNGCSWALIGWYCGNDELALTNTTAPTSNYGTKSTNVTINGDVTYKAVYKKTVSTKTPTTITGATKSITSDTNADGWNTNSSYKSFTTSVQDPIVIDIPSTATITNVALSVSNTWSPKDNNGVTVTIGTTEIGTLIAGAYSIDIPGEKQSKGAKLTLTHTTSARHANHNGITITYSYDGEEETETHYYSTSTDCCTAYNVNIADGITGGTVVADPVKGCEGDAITLTITPDDGKELDELTVGGVDKTSEVVAGEYSFTMPAAAVAVNATFKNQATPFISLTETALDFGQVEKNTTSGELTFTLNANEGCTADVTWALTGDAVFNVTPASPIALASAQAGQTVTVTFSPTAAQDYSATLTFSTTGAESKTIALSGTGINLYTVTFDKGTGICGTASSKQTSLGAAVDLPAATPSTQCAAENWEFAGWSETEVGAETETEPTLLSGETYTPSENKTLYAVYKRTDGDYASDEIDANFTKVTSTSYVAWSNKKGSESEAVYAGKSATNTNESLQIKSDGNDIGVVMTTSGGNVSKVTVDWNSSTTTGRTLDIYGKNTAYSAASDLYGDNKGTKLGSIVKGTSTYLNISGNYAFIGMRSNNGAMYFNSITIDMGSSTTVYHSTPSCTGKATLTYDANSATTGSAPDAVEYDINEEVTVAAMPDGLAKTGHEFAGWNTKADGTGTTYAAGTGSFTIKKNITLYAKWTKKSYTVTVTDPGNGNAITAPANNASIEFGTEVTLTSSAADHWTFNAWSVTETDSENPVTVTNGKFTMPAAAVTVSATFNEDAKRNVLFYSNGEQIGETQAVYVGEKPVAETAIYDACLEGSNIFYGWATAEWSGAIDATDLADQTYYTSTLPNVAAGTGDIEYFAIWAKKSEIARTYVKGTSANLTEGQVVLLVNPNSGVACTHNAHSTGALNPLSVTIDNNTIEIDTDEEDASVRWTVAVTNDNKYQFKSGDNYLRAEGENLLYCKAEDDQWSLNSVSGGYYEFISTQGSVKFQYYSDYSKFTAYKTSKSGANYNMHIYVPATEMVDFRTNCCGLKPVTGLTVSEVAETSVTLSWTAPTSKVGITKYQIVDTEHSIAQDVADVDATSAEVTGLTECTTYHFYVASVGSECNSKSASVPATPYSGALTVTFDYNGGEGSVTSASTSCGVDNVTLPTPDARNGFNFKGWYNGESKVGEAGDSYAPTVTIELQARWAQLYTVHYDFDGVSGAPADAQYEAGETIELPSEPYKSLLAPFEAWDYSVEVTMVDETHFTMPASNLTITATYDEKVGQWIKVTNTNTLSAGDYVVIASEVWDDAMSTTQNDNNRGLADITKVGSTMENPSDNVQVFVLEAGTAEGSWAFKCLNGNEAGKYIYASGSTSNLLKSKTDKDASGSWVLDVAAGKATSQGTASRNILSYNGSDDVFSAYGSVKGEIAFYQFREGTFYNVNLPSPAVTGGVLETNTTMQKAGETVTLTYYPTKGYTVGTLTVTDADEAPIAVSPAVEAGVTEYTFTMPAKEVTVAASFTALPPVVYNLVEDVADLIPGMQLLMVAAKDNNYFANAAWSGDHFNAVSINAPSQKKVSITSEEVKNIILDGESGAWKFMQDGVQRLGTWAISIENGVATIENGDVVKFNHNNGNNPRFKNYDANWTGPKPALYALPTETYNLQFQEENDTPIKTITIAEGYTYKYTIKSTDRPTIPETYEFLAWTDGTNKYKTGDVVTVSTGTILRPCWKVTPTANTDINDLPTSVTEIVVTDGKTLTIGADRNLDNLIVEAGGKVSGSANLIVNDLTIKTSLGTINGDNNTGGKSGEISNSNITANGDVWIEIELTQESAASYGWYAFSVPFKVDAMHGVYGKPDGEDWQELQNEVGYAIMSYHGDVRAQGLYGWKKYRDIMKPGTLYIIAVGKTEYKTLRFKKEADADIVNANQVQVYQYPLQKGGQTGDNGWNGVGNPNLQVSHQNDYSYLQFLDHDDNCFRPRTAAMTNLLVGTAFMVQVAASGNIIIATGANTGTGNIALAPAREPKAIENTIFEVKLKNTDTGKTEDNLFFTAREDATNEYEIGRDVTKMSMGEAKCAQMWVPAYGTQLCAADFQLINDKAEYPLIINTPKAGTYSISVQENENATIYLTYNGRAIWDLSMSACELDLAQGLNEGYGLRLVVNAPAVVTGVDQIDAKAGAQKVIIDEHVYILRGGQMYDVNGKMVK